jgi:hypothetical protein
MYSSIHVFWHLWWLSCIVLAVTWARRSCCKFCLLLLCSWCRLLAAVSSGRDGGLIVEVYRAISSFVRSFKSISKRHWERTAAFLNRGVARACTTYALRVNAPHASSKQAAWLFHQIPRPYRHTYNPTTGLIHPLLPRPGSQRYKPSPTGARKHKRSSDWKPLLSASNLRCLKTTSR